MGQKTKRFIFAMEHKECGMQAIDVPADYTQEQAEEYVREHWDEIELPRNTKYVPNSATPDFYHSSFEEDL